jgi:hypothetical protein
VSKKINIEDVFNGLGVPKQTYVAQDNGSYEKQLIQGLKELGTPCLITGSSKTGKTTLYNRVLDITGKHPLIIRCDETVDADEFWKRPLEKVEFSRLKEIQASKSIETEAKGKIGGEIGWKWLGGLIGEVSLGIKGTRTEIKSREAILSKPSPNHLIPLLQHTNAILVVEDFHYLKEDVQKHIFQQWKVFIDEKVSVIVVGTTHHGVDLAYANSDLIGRIQQIELKRWPDKDLKQIIKKGFNELGIEATPLIVNTIATESVGLPIITQQACGQLFIDKDISYVTKGDEISFTKQQAYTALHNVATTRYKQFESWYTRLTTGPRKAARKYNTYELVLTVFTLDPLKFELKRDEISERIKSLPISDNRKPPKASINSTLSALGKFQKTNGFELLEWSKRDQTIYVVEPAFLYYLRWREAKTSTSGFFDLISEFLKQLNIET